MSKFNIPSSEEMMKTTLQVLKNQEERKLKEKMERKKITDAQTDEVTHLVIANMKKQAELGKFYFAMEISTFFRDFSFEEAKEAIDTLENRFAAAGYELKLSDSQEYLYLKWDE